MSKISKFIVTFTKFGINATNLQERAISPQMMIKLITAAKMLEELIVVFLITS